MTDRSAVRTWARVVAAPTEWTLTVHDPADAAAAGHAARYADLDDRALVRAAVSGERDAFDAIVERHQRSVYQVCYRVVGNHEDASDLAQEAFVRAWRGLARFKGDAALATWLYRIAINLSLNRVSLKTPPLEPIVDDRFVDARYEDPPATIARAERAEAVRRAIATLPRKQRATVILRAYQELSHQQIADILGSSVGTVKANFFHALANLRRALGAEP